MKKLIIAVFVLLLASVYVYADVTDDNTYSVQKFLYDDDKAANNIEYFGWSLPGTATSSATWRIMRITYSGNDMTLEFAGGTKNYAYEWDERGISVAYE